MNPEVGTSGIEVSPSNRDGYGEMITALRLFLDELAAAAPDARTIDLVGGDLRGWASQLAPMRVDVADQVYAERFDLPHRGQALTPEFVVTSAGQDRFEGIAHFGRFHLGGGGAAHGGAISLLFDEVLGLLANSGDRRPARTASLRTDYRSITPIGVDLGFDAWITGEQGRKRTLAARLMHAGTVCAEAEALFITLSDA
jgi:acyl-coenzyme A thioesterase PaaI-like protein